MNPRVAFFDFASCEGCQLQVVNCEDEIPALAKVVDIVNFREALTERSDDYDIAFIEGSCTREADIPRLEGIRKNAKVVVTLGACACLGGVNSLKNLRPMEEGLKYVYGKEAKLYNTFPTRPISAVIQVDLQIPGCPISKEEFLRVVGEVLLGKVPSIPNDPVCNECKKAGNVCVYDKGQTCLGPVTRGGCRAACVTGGTLCYGCRGLIDEPNVNAEKEVLEKAGLCADDLVKKFNLYNTWQQDTWQEVAKK
ncbi:MAG: NADH:ubiquinone oxidoreductase [Chloroflexota bacterium]